MLTEQCGSVIGKRQIEENTVSAAGDIDTFYTSRAPVACTDDTLLVITSDAKGVVMRPEALREATRKAAESKGGNTQRPQLAGATDSLGDSYRELDDLRRALTRLDEITSPTCRRTSCGTEVCTG